MYVDKNILGLAALLLVFAMFFIISHPRRRPRSLFRKERRDTPRHKIALRIKYKTAFEEGVSWLKDISGSGAKLFLNRTLKSLNIGDPLEIEIDIPSENQPVYIKGNIVWAEENDAGFQFDNIAQEDVNRIIQQIS